MNSRILGQQLRVSALLIASSFALSAHAEKVPDHFVPASECKSRPCECSDAPMIERFIRNQKNARSVWVQVAEQIGTDTGPMSGTEARQLFEDNFSGDSWINAQFMTCAGYDEKKNSLKQIAGVPSFGAAALDPCFCNAFCQDIVDSTVNHELAHTPTVLLAFREDAAYVAACKTGLLPDTFCNSLEPGQLAQSEIASYTVGILSLQSDLSDIQQAAPENPAVECTWDPLPDAGARLAPAPVPSGFFERVKLLADRVIYGSAT
jgi:hypothetical protein